MHDFMLKSKMVRFSTTTDLWTSNSCVSHFDIMSNDIKIMIFAFVNLYPTINIVPLSTSANLVNGKWH